MQSPAPTRQNRAVRHHVQAVLLDCGDTLVDEATERKAAGDVVVEASLIPGARELVVELSARGYPLALVADGPVATFENVLGAAGLMGYFDARAISETVGAAKPDPRMFQTALEGLGILGGDPGGSDSDLSHVVMMGNNLARDIRGANLLGITSVWMSWSHRRSRVPADRLEVPDYTVPTPLGLLGVLEELDDCLAMTTGNQLA